MKGMLRVSILNLKTFKNKNSWVSLSRRNTVLLKYKSNGYNHYIASMPSNTWSQSSMFQNRCTQTFFGNIIIYSLKQKWMRKLNYWLHVNDSLFYVLQTFKLFIFISFRWLYCSGISWVSNLRKDTIV